MIYGNLLDISVLEWCKLFGSDDKEKQPMHWKNIAHDPVAFKSALLQKLGITDNQWADYWQEMKKYRDMNVAHYDPIREEIKNFPKLDTALMSSYFYFSYVQGELLKFNKKQLPDDIEAYGREFESECRQIAEVALKTTSDF